MRMLMMFGPMIFRQFKKFQNKKSRQAPQQQREQATKRSDDVRSDYEDTQEEIKRKYNKDEIV